MLGHAAVAMWWNIPERVKSEFEDWHSHEHMPERLRIPGFLRGTRWIDVSDEPSYFVLYEADRLETITGGTYLERLNNPTPWSTKMMPHHRNMVRSLCSVRASFGAGVSQALATIRFSPSAAAASGAIKWLLEDLMPGLPQREGLTGAGLLDSRAVTGTPSTAEQKLRGQDRVADQALLIYGYDAEALKALVEGELGPERLALHGLSSDPVLGVYRLAYSLACADETTKEACRS